MFHILVFFLKVAIVWTKKIVSRCLHFWETARWQLFFLTTAANLTLYNNNNNNNYSDFNRKWGNKFIFASFCLSFVCFEFPLSFICIKQLLYNYFFCSISPFFIVSLTALYIFLPLSLSLCLSFSYFIFLSYCDFFSILSKEIIFVFVSAF